MPPKCSFIQDDCVQIGAWWVELKDLNKVCWTYAKLKGVKKHLRKLQRRTCSRLSLWGLRGLVLSRLMSQWSLTGRSGLAGSPVTPRSPVRRGAPWLLPVGQHRGRDQQSEALWPGGAQGSCQWLCRQYGRVQVRRVCRDVQPRVELCDKRGDGHFESQPWRNKEMTLAVCWDGRVLEFV